MKALIIVAALIVVALVLKLVETFSSMNNIKSVGAKSNKNSQNIAKIDINDPESVKEAVEYYKQFID